MEIPPFYWTLLGEIALVLIGVLSTTIAVVLKDRKKLKEYSTYLKGIINKLKKKLAQSESELNQERVLALLNGLVEHIREQYQSEYGNSITPDDNENNLDDNEHHSDNLPSVEKFVFIAGFQTIIAELSALENSNDPETTWTKIKKELTPLFKNYLEPILSEKQAQVSGDSFVEQLENANQRIENLEKFKHLYFDLQEKLSKSVAEIEALNEKLLIIADGSDNFEEITKIVENNRAHYLEMGQIIGMDKEQHHESVADTMDYSDAIINERKDEIKRLKHKIAQQFENIWKLQNSLSDSDEQPPVEELSASIETISRNLKDAEMCIETMDMEIQTLTSEISNLRNQLKESGANADSAEPSKSTKEKDAMLARFSQESKELMNCITGLEDGNQEQSQKIKELEEKNIKLKAEYSTMESKYLAIMSN